MRPALYIYSGSLYIYERSATNPYIYMVFPFRTACHFMVSGGPRPALYSTPVGARLGRSLPMAPPKGLRNGVKKGPPATNQASFIIMQHGTKCAGAPTRAGYIYIGRFLYIWERPLGGTNFCRLLKPGIEIGMF